MIFEEAGKLLDSVVDTEREPENPHGGEFDVETVLTSTFTLLDLFTKYGL